MMKNNYLYGIVFFTLTIVLLLQGCKKDENEEPGSVYGVVTDKASGEPVKNAGVELKPLGKKTVTGSEGQFEFADIKAGNYNLYITKTGYTDFTSSTVTVNAGQQTQADVQIKEWPSYLRIVDEGGHDISELDFGYLVSDVARSFNIFNTGNSTIEWKITKTADWIASISMVEGILNAGATQSVIITIDRYKLESGDNTTTIHITSNNGSKQLALKAVGQNGQYVILEDYGLMVADADLGSSSWETAIIMCEEAQIGGYADWYLPTIEELSILYDNKNFIGGFSNQYYWSSTEYNSNEIWYIDFSNGNQSHEHKDYYNVRCVRKLY